MWMEIDDFNEPTQVAVDPSGNVYVVDLNGIHIFNSNGDRITQIHVPWYEPSDYFAIRGLGIDSSCALYIVDAKTHRIAKFSPPE